MALVHRGQLELRVNRVHKEIQDKQATTVSQDLKDLKDLRDLQERKETQGALGILELLVALVLLDLQDLKVVQDLLVPPAYPDSQVQLEIQDLRVLLVHQDPLVMSDR